MPLGKGRHDHELAKFTDESEVRVSVEGEVSINDVGADRAASLQESVDELVVQLKILNSYMSHGFDMDITKEDT